MKVQGSRYICIWGYQKENTFDLGLKEQAGFGYAEVRQNFTPGRWSKWESTQRWDEVQELM